MGLIINPVSTRLKLNNFWEFTWSSYNNNNYTYLINQDFNLLKFISWLNRSKILKKNDFLFFDIKIIKSFNKIKIYIVFTIRRLNRKFKYEFYNKMKGSFRVNPGFERYSVKYRRKALLIIITLNCYKFFLIYHIAKINFYLKFICYYFISRILNINKNNIKFNITQNINRKLTSKYLANFIQKQQLKNGNRSINSLIRFAINIIQRKNKKKKIIKGYKIKIVGRFSRRSRSSKLVYQEGPVTSGKFSVPLDYTFILIRTRYGISGLKIWLNFSKK